MPARSFTYLLASRPFLVPHTNPSRYPLSPPIRILSLIFLHTCMSPTDRTPLLENGNGVNGHERGPSHRERFVNLFVIPDDQPGWIQSTKFFLFGSWMNVTLVFVPLSFVSHHLGWDAALRFSFSFLAIMPLAKVCATRLLLGFTVFSRVDFSG